MRLPAEFTVARCEIALIELDRNLTDNECIVPTKAKHAQFGGEAAMSQVIITWSQLRDPCKLTLFADQDETSQADEFVSRLHGLVAALCCQTACSFATKSDLSQLVKNAALKRLDALYGNQPWLATRGIAVEILCADHLARSSPAILYKSREESSGSLRSEIEFQAIARRLLRSATPQVYHSWLKPNDVNDAGSLIYELFKNTDDHAKSDWSGARLKSSIRGITIRHHLIKRSDLKSQIGDMAGMRPFESRIAPPFERASNLQLLEISVFDSGPGYAPRLLQKPLHEIRPADEVAAVADCFERNISVKRDDGSGMGLPYVLELLRRHQGVMKLRTGRLSMILDPAAVVEGIGAGKLRDIGGSNEVCQLAPANGALITIFLPLTAP